MTRPEKEQHFIAIEDAAQEMGIKRSSMYHYIHTFDIKTERFKLDRRRYLALSDFNRIKEAKQAAAERKH